MEGLSETRPHLEGIATVLGKEAFPFFSFNRVGNKTSFRRDCDVPGPLLCRRLLVGNKTSFRRDCDLELFSCSNAASSETRPHLEGIATSPVSAIFFSSFEVGNKTSFRRDCDCRSHHMLRPRYCRKQDLI